VMNETVFITIPYSVLKKGSNLKFESDLGINILFDCAEIDLPFVISIVNKIDFKYIYSLTGLLLDNNNVDSILSKLYVLYTLSGCFDKSINSIAVFDFAAQEQGINLQRVKEYFQLQEEQKVDFVIVPPAESFITNNILFCSTTHLDAINERKLEEYIQQKLNQVIISFNPSISTLNIMDALKHSPDNNRHINLLFQFVEVRNTADLISHQSDLWQSRAKLYLSFIDLSKKIGEKEYYDVRKWYHKEYEVLPLWYKQFGHIVKVLTGKRDFRSLFDNKKER
jgi:hypothetical protein